MPVRARIAARPGATANTSKSGDDNSSQAAAAPQAPFDANKVTKERKCCGASGGGSGENDELVLRVHVIGAKNLAPKDDPEDKTQSEWGQSDPFAVVHCGTESIQTEVKEKELSPTWDTVLEFTKFQPDTCFREFWALKEDGDKELLRESALKIEVYDWDEGQFESDELIGVAQLPFPHRLWEEMQKEPDSEDLPSGGTRLSHPCFGWEEAWLNLERRNPVTEQMEPVFFQEHEFKHKDGSGKTIQGYYSPVKQPPGVRQRYMTGLEPVKDIDGDGKCDAWGIGLRARNVEVVEVDKHNQRYLVRYDEKMVKRECWGAFGTTEEERPGSPMLALQLTDPDAEGEFVGVVLVQVLVIHKREITRRQHAKRAQLDIQRQIKVKKKRAKATARSRGRASMR